MSLSNINGLPPTPPNSTEGELTPEKIESNQMYPPVPIYGTPSNGNGLDFMKGHYNPIIHQDPSAMYSPPPYYSHSIPSSFSMGIPGQQVNTPPTTVDDEAIMTAHRVQSASPSWSSPRRRAPPPRAKLSKSPREKRRASQRDPTKNSRGSIPITGPLSEITNHLVDIPLKDMTAYVSRPIEERLKEAREKGKVPRPMNSFMLYRSSYAPRIKVLIGQTNHQEVSKAAGCGWRLEPSDIREMYEELAKTERDNHTTTHPDYKFKPQKGPATTKVVGGLTPPPVSMGLGLDAGSPSHWDDPDFALGGLNLHSRSQSYDVDGLTHSSRTSTPFECIEPGNGGGYMNSWGASYPGTSMPTVHPSALHSSMGSQVEDVHFRRTPAPMEMQYGLSSSLAGLPGGSHHDLLQPHQTPSLPGRINETANLDPQMLSYDNMSSGIPGTMSESYPTVSNPFPVWPADNNCYLPPTETAASPPQYSQHASNAYLPNIQRTTSWDTAHHESHEVADSEWVDVGASNIWKVEEL